MAKAPQRPPWKEFDPCPCGSGQTLLGCCLLASGHLRKRVPSLSPPGDRTGYSQSGCYLEATGNCSQGLTGEHYVSKTVLKTIGEDIAIDGMPWLKPGEQRIVSVQSLTANLLCERHNNALSPLDAEAGQLSRCLKDIHDDLGKRSLSRRRSSHLISGEMIELWMLKVTAGICLSFASRDGVKLKIDHIFDRHKLTQAFANGLREEVDEL